MCRRKPLPFVLVVTLWIMALIVAVAITFATTAHADDDVTKHFVSMLVIVGFTLCVYGTSLVKENCCHRRGKNNNNDSQHQRHQNQSIEQQQQHHQEGDATTDAKKEPELERSATTDAPLVTTPGAANPSSSAPAAPQIIAAADVDLNTTTKDINDQELGTMEEAVTASSQEQQLEEEPASNKQQTASSTSAPERPARIYFLDAVKVFLTVMVVSVHASCGFGGCGAAWFFAVGLYENAFSRLVNAVFVTTNQAYFMPCFFFVSAYFVPGSYDRKGKRTFLYDRAKRIWIPAMVATYTLIPATMAIAYAAGGNPVRYAPLPGQCWFLFWLLVFDYAYATIRESMDHSKQQEQQRQQSQQGDNDTAAANDIDGEQQQKPDEAVLRPFPGPAKRWLCGLFICGLLMLAFTYACGGRGADYFFYMPLWIGSFTCDVFFFAMGVVASANKWLEHRLLSGASPWSWIGIYLAALAEAIALIAMTIFANDGALLSLILRYAVAGLFCVDMILVVLHFFQRCANNKMQRIGLALTQSAYTVYLIHPLVVVGLTSVFVQVYNAIYGPIITFDEGMILSGSTLLGPGDGSLHLFVGWILVLIATHVIVWPLAYAIRSLPMLRDIL